MCTDPQWQRLARSAAVWQLTLTETDLDRFERYATLLEAGNRQINLTRIHPEDYGTLHFLDSLALAAIERPAAGARLIDVGTGAGFPGLPLAIAFPELDVTLADATLKRLRFVQEVIAELGLRNARTVHARAEELARSPMHRAHYDLVVARAVAAMPVLADWLIPLARPSGLVVAYKSRDVSEEIAAARPKIAAQGADFERAVEIALPETDIVRTLVRIRKRRIVSGRATPTGGPR